MRSKSLILLTILTWFGVAAADEPLRPELLIAPRTIEYELYHPRGAEVPFRLEVTNRGEARDAYVVILVHEQNTGATYELYSRPTAIGAFEQATFGERDNPLTFRVERDGLYSIAAAVYTSAGAEDIRADIVYEKRLLYVGSARPKAGCFRE